MGLPATTIYSTLQALQQYTICLPNVEPLEIKRMLIGALQHSDRVSFAPTFATVTRGEPATLVSVDDSVDLGVARLRDRIDAVDQVQAEQRNGQREHRDDD
jgi:hypothetical protein